MPLLTVLRCCCFVILLVIRPDLLAQETGERSDQKLSGLDALDRFSATEKYLGDAPSDEKAVRNRLAAHCSGAPAPKCIKYLKANRSEILAVLPNNPEYWLAYHALINGPALELDPSGEAYTRSPEKRTGLIDAAQDWVYRAIVQDDIQKVTDQIVPYYQNVCRQMSESSTLLDHTIFLALVGIVHSQIEKLMALHASDGNLESIKKLAAMLTPFSRQERSFRRALQGEAQLTQSSPKWLEKEWVAYLDRHQVPGRSLDEQKKAALEISRVQWGKIIESIGEATERSWSEFYEKGYSSLEHRLPESGTAFARDINGVRSFANGIRMAEASIYPLLALSDIYLGATSPGVPARQPPPFWSWVWHEASKEICLAPTQVAPDTTHLIGDQAICRTYVPVVP